MIGELIPIIIGTEHWELRTETDNYRDCLVKTGDWVLKTDDWVLKTDDWVLKTDDCY